MAADTISRGRLRRLAEVHPQRGLVLSVFFNLDPSEFATAAARSTEATSVLTEAAHKADQAGERLGHEERQALKADVERVREVLAGGDLAQNGTQGLAVYVCGPADLLEVIRLPHPIESRVMVDETPCVAPLLRYGTDDEEWCVLLVNRRIARIFCGPASALEEIEQIEDDTHGQHQQGGWSQANYQRSVEQEKLTHLQRSLDTLFTHFKRSRFDHLVVGSPEDLAGEVEDRMHPYLRERLAGRITIDVENTGADEVRAAAAGVVEKRITAREREALDRMAEGVGRGGRGAAGIADVMAALEQARVEILLLADGFDAPERESAIEQAITQSADVLVVRHHDDLEQHGGIGAVLRF
jgi:peptide subunit release factor 1 (eRF1)